MRQLCSHFRPFPSPTPRGNNAYLKAVNVMQTAEQYDARLHLEWSRLLREQVTRESEADAHAEFAVRAFAHAHAAEAPGGKGAAAAAAAHAAAAAEHAAWRGRPSRPASIAQMKDKVLTLREDL